MRTTKVAPQDRARFETLKTDARLPWLLLALVLLVAAGLRLWGLPGTPAGPHYDEAANGILAAEIAHGDEMPVFIPSYTGKEVLFFYWAAAWMRALGAQLLALRLTSALAGLLTVAAAAWLAYELFADDDPDGAPWLTVLTAALLATSFWHVLLSRLGFRAITQPLLQALALAALWRGLRQRPVRRCALRQHPERSGGLDHLHRAAVAGAKPVAGLRLGDRGWPLLGGLLCGLSGYTYLAARAFPIPLAVTFGALLIADVGHRRRRLVQCSLFGLAALASFAPLGLYFVRHPDAFTTRMGQVGPGDDWNAALDGLAAAFKMLFGRGDPYIRFNLPFRPLFGPLVALLFIAGLGITVWRLFRPRTTGPSPALSRAREMLLLVWIPVMLLPTALAVNEITPSNLRAVGLIPVVFIFPARGVWCITNPASRSAMLRGLESRMGRAESPRGKRHTNLLPLVTCALLFTTAFITARAYFSEYAPRTDLYEASDGDLYDIAAYLNRADLTDTTVYVGSIHYRHPTLAFLADVYPRIKWLVGAATLVYPASGGALYLFPRSAAPDVNWLARHAPAATPIEAPLATDGAPAFTGYRLAAPADHYEEAVVDFSGVVRLLSYQVAGAVSGSKADVTLVWQILAPPPYSDLTPFYHLVDPWGFRWGQAEPFHYAAADWTAGEIVLDRVQVPVAAGAPPGDYLLQAGLYSRSANTRLAVVDDAGRYSGTTVPLTVTVTRAATPPGPGRLGIRQRLDRQTGAGLTLLGADLDSTQARPGERVHLTLFWRADQESADCVVNLLLQNSAGHDLSLYSGAPVHGTYPSGRWKKDEIVIDRYNPRLPLDANDLRPGDYTLALSLSGPDGETLIDSLVLGRLTLVATERVFETPPIRNIPVEQTILAAQIEFLGYDLDLTDARPGGTVHLILYWRALAAMDTSFTVFTHLLGPDGSVAAQQDNPPVNGTYPTTLWLPGEIITDPYHIQLPADLPPGDYPLQVGFYVAANGLRLGDPILLDTVVSICP